MLGCQQEEINLRQLKLNNGLQCDPEKLSLSDTIIWIEHCKKKNSMCSHSIIENCHNKN